MHLLYLDESGEPTDPRSDFFVLAGVIAFERVTHWVDARLGHLAARVDPDTPSAIEFHGAPMRAGKGVWRTLPSEHRAQLTVDVLNVLGQPSLGLKVVASVIEKSTVPRNKLLERSFENVAHLFDRFLADSWHREGRRERGVVVCDKCSAEHSLQMMSKDFKRRGHQFGKTRNFSEVPMFLDSRASRMVQLADMVAYWTYRRYQSLDERGFELVRPHLLLRDGEAVGLIEQLSASTRAALTRPQHGTHLFPSPTAGPAEMMPIAAPAAIDAMAA